MKAARRLLLACVVVKDPTLLEPHEYVVLGKVKSSFGDEVTIEPRKYFKGEPHQRLVVYSSPKDDSDCNPSLVPGATYLLYGAKMAPPQRPYLAVSLALPAKEAEGVLSQLGEGKKPSVSGSNLSPRRESTRGQRASAGIVIGMAIGVVALLFTVIALVYWLVIRRIRQRRG